jgi:hypothetical protein
MVCHPAVASTIEFWLSANEFDNTRLEKTMLRTMRVFLLFSMGWIATACQAEPPAVVKPHPDSAAWANLFEKDLSDATFPKGVWSFTDGVLTATEDQCIWTKKQYENFVIDLEFKNAKGTNSRDVPGNVKTDSGLLIV